MAFRCSICDVSYNSQKKIDTHYNTKKHKKQVLFNKDLSSSSEDTTEENDVHVIISNMDAKFTLALDEQKQSIEKLKKENEALRKKVLCLESARRGDIINSYNGNNQIINSNLKVEVVQIRALGEEEISHITESLAMKMMSKCTYFVRDLMKEIHFNTEHPENHNISIPNKNKNIIKTYDGEFWESGNKKEAMESIVESLFDKFDTIYGEKFRDKYGEKFFVKRWVNRVDILTDSENELHEETMKTEVDNLNSMMLDAGDRLKLIYRRRKIKREELARQKYKLHVEVYKEEEKKREDARKKSIDNKQCEPYYDQSIDDFTTDFVNNHFDYEKFERSYVHPGIHDDRIQIC